MQKVIIANLLNELMINKPELNYAKPLSFVTPRKMWIANNDDIIITPIKISSVFKNYVCSITKQDQDRVINLTPQGKVTEYLADRIFNDKQIFDQLNYIIKQDPKIFEMLCFAPDNPTLNLAKKLKLGIVGYSSFPSKKLIDLFYKLNTKAEFRKLANSLGFLTTPGIICNDIKKLPQNIMELLSSYPTIIMKFNRGSNGFGHLIINKTQGFASNFLEILNQHLTNYNQPNQFILEAFIESKAFPSVELFVDDNGPCVTYVCDQRCKNSAYSGMVTPPHHLEAIVIDQLVNMGLIFGQYVFEKGFRGTFDIDFCLDNKNQLFVTETNFRRTAGSFIDTLARHLIANDYYKNNVWIQDAKITQSNYSFQDGLEMIDKHGLAYDSSTKIGIISYVDTLEFDKKWRYIIFAKDLMMAESMENQLCDLLKLI